VNSHACSVFKPLAALCFSYTWTLFYLPGLFVTWAGSFMQTIGAVWTAHVPIGIAAGSDMMLIR